MQFCAVSVLRQIGAKDADGTLACIVEMCYDITSILKVV